ncbi:LSB6 [Sanghuangporus sanghuang]
MPNRAEYQPLSQSADGEGEELDGNAAGPSGLSASNRRSTGVRPSSRPGPIDLKKLDVAFKRWTESIAQKVKGKKKVEPSDSRKEILRSVFEPQIFPQLSPPTVIKTLDHGPPMSQADFDRLVLSIQRAISEGVHPKMISKGSSGSYFARDKVDGRIQTVAVFKPKDEEPYGRMNPKTTKWLHRKFRWLIPFGRACLIPNLSYISEAAASLLDDRLNLNIVPKTQLASFSSPAFFYDWLDRNAAKKGKPLPEKIGSLQVFMHGYQDASDFLRKHPWPGRSIRDTFDDSSHRTGRFRKRFLSALSVVCGKTGDEEEANDVYDFDEERMLYDASEDDGSGHPFYWSATLQESFREELEKLVILDYIMHNTDRGADNYMIKCCDAEHEKSLVDVAPSRTDALQMPMMGEVRKEGMISTPHMPSIGGSSSTLLSTSPQPTRVPSRNQEQPYTRYPHIHIAAIDNSLAFPHEHPKGWRSYTYGWLYLPVSLIGQPFSQKTRDHFLPLLTSKAWWEETAYQLRKLFAVDPGFNRMMFQRQLAVIKGQAYNVVQSLKHNDEGPLELTRRQKMLVWDDEVEVVEDTFAELLVGPKSASPKPSVKTLPISLPTSPRHQRALSQGAADGASANGRGFPPPVRPRATDARPVPFVTKLPRVHPGTSGVTVLEHMERVDAVEAGLRRLAVDGDVIAEEDEEEEDVAVAASAGRGHRPSTIREDAHEDEREQEEGSRTPTAASPVISPASEMPEAGGRDSLANSVTEEDLVAMSSSMSALDSRAAPLHMRLCSQGAPEASGSTRPNLDWIQGETVDKKRIMINERVEAVETKALCSCW